MAPKAKDDEGNAIWTTEETIALLDGLIEKKNSALQSGNGWKPCVWTDLVAKVQAVNPNAKPVKDEKKVTYKLKNLQATFAVYVFVEQYSGTGWSDEKKMCIVEKDYAEEFVAKHGQKFVTCFKRPCPFYEKLDEIFDKLSSRATGDEVVHLSKKKRGSKGKKAKENPPVAGPSLSHTETPSTPSRPAAPSEPRTPMASVDNAPGDRAHAGSQRGEFDDELSITSPKTRKRVRADSDEDDDTTDSDVKRRRRKSDTSNGSARSNAAAGSQLARSVEGLSAAMGKPIVTSTDVSFVDEVVDILSNNDILPDDPRGRLFVIVSKALTSSPTSARIFVLARNDVRRKAIIRGILEEADEYVPEEY